MNKNMANHVYLFFTPEYVKCSPAFNTVLTKIKDDECSGEPIITVGHFIGKYLLANKPKEDIKDVAALNLQMDRIMNCVNPPVNIPSPYDGEAKLRKGYLPTDLEKYEFSSCKIVSPVIKASTLQGLTETLIPITRVMDNDVNVAIDAIMDNTIIADTTIEDINFMDIEWYKISCDNENIDLGIITLNKGFGNYLMGTSGLSAKSKLRSNILRKLYLSYLKHADVKTIFSSGLYAKYLTSYQVAAPSFVNYL